MRLLPSLVIPSVLICLFFLSACQQEEPKTPLRNDGFVAANKAYQEHFGLPPQGKAGHAFARVGYLPLKNDTAKLRAVPLFLFSEQEELRQILERLISGDLLQQRESALYNPFPDDIKITVSNPEGPLVTLSLVTQQSWPTAALAAAARALAETTLQFAKVERVVILFNEVALPQMPAGGYSRVPQTLVKVDLPELALMAGVWEDGSDNLDEILIEFDRPIKINNFKLYDETDTVVDGEYFTSLFQMAVVVHPKNPELYRAGTVLRAEWDVVDYLGRTNRGTDSLPLQRIDH